MIRDVEPSDIPSIARMLKSLGYNTTQKNLEEKLAAYQHSDEYAVMLDVEEDKINGVIGLHTINSFHTKAKTGRVMTLIFDESYRGHRAGRMLIEAADQFFKERGCHAVEVTGATVRSTARKLFQNQGYAEAERQFIKQYRGGR